MRKANGSGPPRSAASRLHVATTCLCLAFAPGAADCAGAEQLFTTPTESPVTITVETSGYLPQVANLQQYTATQMAAARLSGWRFSPASPGAPPEADRVEWRFRMSPRAVPRTRSHAMRPYGACVVEMCVTLYLNGVQRGTVCGEAVAGPRRRERDVAAGIADLTKELFTRYGVQIRPPHVAVSRQAEAAAARPSGRVPHSLWERKELTGEWLPARRTLESRGITVDAIWIAEGFYNFQGGIRTGTLATMTPNVDATFDLEKLIGLSGAEARVSLEGNANNDPSAVLIGDLQRFTKLGAAPFIQIYDLWYQQKLFDNTFRIKAGKMDANSEFSVVNNGLEFLNSSAQVSPTVLGFPTYPFPSAGLTLFFTPHNPFYASFGVYAAGANGRFLVFYGHPEEFQPTLNGTLFIGETGLNWSGSPQLNSDRNLRLGFWGNTGTFTRFDGGTQQGARGFYAILDEVLWRPAHDKAGAHDNLDTRGLRTFLEYGYTDCAVAPVCRHYGAGISWKGPLAQRANDEAGFTAQYAHLSPGLLAPHPYEMALEVFYRIEIAPWAIVQPDFQYIVHPSGKYPSAAVGTLFLQFSF